MADLPIGLTRRRFLTTAAGAAAGVALLGACGGDDDPGDATGPEDEGRTSDLVMAPYVGGSIYGVGIPTRIPFGIADSDGLLPIADTPDEVEVTIVDSDDRPIGDPITVRRHAEGLQRAYFPLEVTIEEAGLYTARATLVEGQAASSIAFAVNALDELTALLKPGDAMPSVATPTTADALGVDPICTADPVCALHDVTLADALAAGGPLAVLVATPAFCKVSACGPVHHVLLETIGAHPAVTALHLEVYAHPFENLDDYAPVIADLDLPHEPILFLVGSDGTIMERLDSIYDRVELGEKLSSLA